MVQVRVEAAQVASAEAVVREITTEVEEEGIRVALVAPVIVTVLAEAEAELIV